MDVMASGRSAIDRACSSLRAEQPSTRPPPAHPFQRRPTAQGSASEANVNRLVEFATTVIAGAAGSAVVVLSVGASLMLVVPVSVGVGVLVLAAGHEPRPRDLDTQPQDA